MDWLFAVVVFVFVAIVCGVVLLIRRIKGNREPEVTRFILSLGFFIAAGLVFISAASDIRERFPKLTFSCVYVAVIFVILLAWLVVLKYLKYKAEKDRESEYSFTYKRACDVAQRYTGDDITRFLKDYGISESRFKEEFVSSAIRSGIAEYRRKHPLDE